MKTGNRTHWMAGMIAMATLLVYLRALQNDFVDWDDRSYVIDNIHIRVFDMSLFKWAFLDFYAANWHPLTWLSHALDIAAWGLNPAGHHLTNILLHAVNTFLVVLLSAKLLQAWHERSLPVGARSFLHGQGALIAAAATGLLFGLHPLHVESVAWVAERKDLLCSLFFLLSIMYYIRHVSATGSPGEQSGRGKRLLQREYVACLALFILALLSKPMAVSLPAVLLILDWHPLGRIGSFKSFQACVAEKTPFLLLSLVSSIVTVYAQHAGDAIVPLEYFPLATRVLVAMQSLLGYLGKMALPVSLLPYYAYPEGVSLLSPEYLFPAVVAAGVSLGSFLLAGRQPVWLAIWGYYVLTLLPVLGIIQVGNQAMADRYTYLPSLGPFLMLGIGAAWMWTKAADLKQWRNAARAGIIAGALCLAAGAAYATYAQIAVWKSSLDLWNYVLRNDPEAGAIPYNNRGELYYKMGQFDLALEDMNKAVAFSPADPVFYNNRGLAFEQTGRLQDAMADYSKAIALSSSYPMAYYNRGLLFIKMRQPAEALADFDQAIAIDPSDATFYNNRGIVFAGGGRSDRALADFNRAIEIDPDHVSTYLNRGNLHLREGRKTLALQDFQQACDRGSGEGCGALQYFQLR